MRVHLFAPCGFAEKPTGGNVYDGHLRRELVARGWDVITHEADPDDVSATVADIASGELVLVDSLVASWAPQAFRSRAPGVVPLVHLIFGVAGERELLADAGAVVATSEWTRRRLVRERVDPRRVHIAVPGVERARLRTGTPSGSRLVCVATLVPDKGHDVLVAALAELIDLDWTCTLVGSLDRDPEYVERLRKRAAQAGITDRIRFAGEVSRDELETTYAQSDLALLPSRGETYGMVVAEALMHGVPVIASKVGGVPEALGTVERGNPGMLVRPDDPAALARALRRWLEDPSLRRWLRQLTGDRRRTLPTWSATAAAVVQALESA